MKRVVVTGIGAVTPLGMTMKATWEGLMEGRCGLKKIDDVPVFWKGWEKERLDSAITCRVAGGVEDDGTLFGDSRTSRATKFAVKACEEALQNAQLDIIPEIRQDVGVTVGTGMSSLNDTAEVTRALDSGKPKLVTPFFVPKILCNAAAGTIGIKYKINGPNHSASTACATGAHGIGDGYRFIQHGDAKVMICGGTESCLNPIAFVGFQRAKAMSTVSNESPEEASRPFDHARSGFLMSEGAAILILEEYEFAKQRNAPILAEVTGYGLSGDGYHVTSPHPESLGMRLCMTRALAQHNGKTAQPISYLNAHATSTPMGDELEASAINELFDAPVPVSSTKGHLGHLLGASGAIEAGVSIMSLHMGEAPGTLNLSTAPENTSNITYLTEKRNPIRGGGAVLSNSFGFGGTNTSLVFSSV
eukprot:TRINITY_DN6226_c0_g3_i1.p1 TRINITY_DN6226_c0_g3~~TRINITY_DN6226_c0_g3_i1.p1  ORF type:complete len:433 (+),score=72.19 TRINITY_DN6226_c0_g3_i1:47-1300(+)